MMRSCIGHTRPEYTPKCNQDENSRFTIWKCSTAWDPLHHIHSGTTPTKHISVRLNPAVLLDSGEIVVLAEAAESKLLPHCGWRDWRPLAAKAANMRNTCTGHLPHKYQYEILDNSSICEYQKQVHNMNS